MKTLSTVVAGTLLAIGLASNAAASPGHQVYGHGAKKVVIVKAAPKKVVKKVVVQKAAQKKVIKKFAKKVHVKTYNVRRGDTLRSIAARHRISVKYLMKVNGLWGKKANNLRTGMKIRVS